MQTLNTTLRYVEGLLNSGNTNADLFINAYNVTDMSMNYSDLSPLNLSSVIDAIEGGMTGLVQYADVPDFNGTVYVGEIQLFCNGLNALPDNMSRMQYLANQNSLSGYDLSYNASIE